MHPTKERQSIWQQFASPYQPTSVAEPQRTYDVIVVGGGITGITTALLLQQGGLQTLLLEAETPGAGTTGYTTAHLNSFPEVEVSQLARNFNKEDIRLVMEAFDQAFILVRNLVNRYSIDCDFQEKEGYIFSNSAEESDRLVKWTEDLAAYGKEAALVNVSGIPIPYQRISCIRQQAQFSPLEYIYGLAAAFEQAGGHIQLHSRVTGTEQMQEAIQVLSSGGAFFAKKLVYATHFTPGVNMLHFRSFPMRTYVIAFLLKNREQYPTDLYYDMKDPYHYYRTATINGQQYLVAGGEDHKTGDKKNTETCYRNLEAFVRNYFEVESVAGKWSSQYYDTADGLAYIGLLPGDHSENTYVATGFGGTGTVYGTLSALILSEMLLKGSSRYEEIFDPARIKLFAGFKKVVESAGDVMVNLIGGVLPQEKITELSDIAKGEARIIQFEDKKIGVYRDQKGSLHLVNPVCTHLHCLLDWNGAETSWDCTCHGSRFSPDGKVLTGPAVRDLQQITLKG